MEFTAQNQSVRAADKTHLPLSEFVKFIRHCVQIDAGKVGHLMGTSEEPLEFRQFSFNVNFLGTACESQPTCCVTSVKLTSLVVLEKLWRRVFSS